MSFAGARKAETLERAFAGRSLWADARARLFRNKAAVGGMAVLAAVLLIMLMVSWPGAMAWAIVSGWVVYRYEKPRSRI